MVTLVELYTKNNHNTDKWGDAPGSHAYLNIYDKLFAPLQERKNNILEIGVFRGDSLNLFAEYFTNSMIYGIDCNLPQIDVKLHKNVKTIDADAYDEKIFKQISKIGKFDVIIDDGSHERGHQYFVAKYYSKLLTKDGILIIEEATMVTKKIGKVLHLRKMYNSFPESIRKFAYYVDGEAYGKKGDSLVICNKMGKK